MAQDAQVIERLARELAALTPEDRARVEAAVVRAKSLSTKPAKFSIPLLSGGAEWTGGDLRREELYGDDGR